MQTNDEDTVKVWSSPLLEITTKSTHFLSGEKNVPIMWIELQANKNTKGIKTLHLNIDL